eukprot:6144642-Pleurochrysis_carterae.AAC.5
MRGGGERMSRTLLATYLQICLDRRVLLDGGADGEVDGLLPGERSDGDQAAVHGAAGRVVARHRLQVVDHKGLGCAHPLLEVARERVVACAGRASRAEKRRGTRKVRGREVEQVKVRGKEGDSGMREGVRGRGRGR